MNRPGLRWRARLAALGAAGALLVGLFPMAGTALGAVITTPASATISADTAVGAPLGTTAWTALTGPVVTEQIAADIPNSGTVTLTLTGGWELRTTALGGAVDVVPSVASGTTCGITATGEAVSATTITVTLGGTVTTGANRCRLTWSGIQVRPTSGLVIPNPGALTLSGVLAGPAGALTMTIGAPVLTFFQQPSPSAPGGAVLATQPRVESEDQFKRKRVGDVIILAVNSGPSGGSLTCNPTTNQMATSDAGADAIATFAGCSLDKVGTYTLRATTAGQVGTVPVSNPPTVISVGSAAKLVFYQRPNAAVAGVNFPIQPIVAVADAAGNIRPSDVARTISITANPAGGLSCSTGPSNVSTAVTAIGMAATFAGCRITSAGVGYTLTATSPSLTSATTAAFDVENAIVFSQQPSGAIGGAVFTTQPIVALRANGSNAVNDSTTLVSLSIRSGTGASGAILTCSGGLSKTVTAGVANFTGCSIDRLSPSGNPYQLVASTSTGLASVNSSTFAVTVGPAVKLAFTTQPGNANVGQTFPTAPVVTIQDAGGNTVTTGASATASVTLAIGTNPGSGALACTGGLTKAAVAGVVTFTGCSISAVGTGYTLVASSSGLTSATSSAFNVTAPAAVMTLIRSTGMITVGQTATLSVQFAANGSGRTVVLEWTYAGFPWTAVASGTTNSNGFASLTAAPNRSGYYRVRFDGAPNLTAAFSNVVLVGVRQTIALNPSHRGTMTIAQGRSITFRGTVRPTRPDGVASRVTFRFFERRSGTWVLRSQRRVATDASGVARTTFRFGVRGSWYVMAFAETTPYNAVSRFSQREYFLVR